jgi:hypothetical protein
MLFSRCQMTGAFVVTWKQSSALPAEFAISYSSGNCVRAVKPQALGVRCFAAQDACSTAVLSKRAAIITSVPTNQCL